MIAQPQVTPSDLDATIRSFHLTSAELAEVEALKLYLVSPTPTQSQALKDVARTTANAGLQYLLFNQPDLVKLVASNEYLDPRAIPPFLERIASTKRRSFPAEIHAVRSLLPHKSVVGNVFLFRQVWEVLILLNDNLTSSVKEATNLTLLYSVLNLHSFPTKEDGNAMSIDTLMLVLAYMGNQALGGGVNIGLTMDAVCTKVLEAREDEIKAWIQENMPDYVDIPLSWVLRAFGLYQAT